MPDKEHSASVRQDTSKFGDLTCGCGKQAKYLTNGGMACNKRFRCLSNEESQQRIIDLMRALHEAIDMPKGVVPESAERFYIPRSEIGQ